MKKYIVCLIGLLFFMNMPLCAMKFVADIVRKVMPTTRPPLTNKPASRSFFNFWRSKPAKPPSHAPKPPSEEITPPLTEELSTEALGKQKKHPNLHEVMEFVLREKNKQVQEANRSVWFKRTRNSFAKIGLVTAGAILGSFTTYRGLEGARKTQVREWEAKNTREQLRIKRQQDALEAAKLALEKEKLALEKEKFEAEQINLEQEMSDRFVRYYNYKKAGEQSYFGPAVKSYEDWWKAEQAEQAK